MKQKLPLVISLIAAVIATFIAVTTGSLNAIAACSAIVLPLAMQGAFRLIRSLLWVEQTWSTVAAASIDELRRSRGALLAPCALCLWLALLPLTFDPATPLQYRVQTFLSNSLGISTFMLGMLTLFAACGGINREIENQRIFSILVKPVHRASFLFGKWASLMILNASALFVIALYVVAMTHVMSTRQSEAETDRETVRGSVLSARERFLPTPAESFDRRVDRQLKKLESENPQTLVAIGGVEARRQLAQQAERNWLSIKPYERETYLFENVPDAARELLLKFKLQVLRARMHTGQPVVLELVINERRIPISMHPGIFQYFPVPAEWVGSDRKLSLTVVNVHLINPEKTEKISLLFQPGDLELLCAAGSLEQNLFRALLIESIKLGFLAMLGTFLSAFLSFPVATVAALMVYTVATGAGYLADSLRFYADMSDAGSVQAASSTLAWIMELPLIQQFGRSAPIAQVVEGRAIAWLDVGECAIWIGFLWCGIIALLAVPIFQRRELGRVQV